MKQKDTCQATKTYLLNHKSLTNKKKMSHRRRRAVSEISVLPHEEILQNEDDDNDDLEAYFLEVKQQQTQNIVDDGVATLAQVCHDMLAVGEKPIGSDEIRSVAWRIYGKPVSVNRRQLFNHQSGKVFDSPETKQWKQTILNSVPKGVRIDGPVAVTFMYVFRDRRAHDVDNYAKVMLDALKNVVFGDDNDIYFLYQAKVTGAAASTDRDFVDVRVEQLSPGMHAILEKYNPPPPPPPLSHDAPPKPKRARTSVTAAATAPKRKPANP